MNTPSHATRAPITVRPPATIAQAALTAAGILASARAAGLPDPSSVTVHGYGPPDVTLHIHADGPAATWKALETWASRHGHHGDRAITVGPASLDGDAYAYTEFTRTGVRIRAYAIITGNPATGTGSEPAAPGDGDASTGTTSR